MQFFSSHYAILHTVYLWTLWIFDFQRFSIFQRFLITVDRSPIDLTDFLWTHQFHLTFSSPINLVNEFCLYVIRGKYLEKRHRWCTCDPIYVAKFTQNWTIRRGLFIVWYIYIFIYDVSRTGLFEQVFHDWVSQATTQTNI